jgi:hypothetical protein
VIGTWFAIKQAENGLNYLNFNNLGYKPEKRDRHANDSVDNLGAVFLYVANGLGG